MSFATINWCKQAILLIVIICFYGNNALSCFAMQTKPNKLDLSNNRIRGYHQKTNILSAQKISSCQEVDNSYQEVYSFETENFYISICQSQNIFYYHRQSKTNSDNDVFIEAQAVFGGNVFQANQGKVIYFVGKDGDRYYSSVMQNTDEIVFEPELPPPLFSRNVPERQVDFSAANVTLLKLEGISYVNWESEFSQVEGEDSLVCTNNKSRSNVNFENWGTLLGESTDTAHTYARGNGHNFVYDDKIPHQALIETKEGTIINLNIATTTETIERICIEPVADNF